MSKKVYLGDSVYANVNRIGQLVLTTENGEPGDPSNTIILEPDVYDALELYAARVWQTTQRTAG
jgi:hypothetical protein